MIAHQWLLSGCEYLQGVEAYRYCNGCVNMTAHEIEMFVDVQQGVEICPCFNERISNGVHGMWKHVTMLPSMGIGPLCHGPASPKASKAAAKNAKWAIVQWLLDK